MLMMNKPTVKQMTTIWTARAMFSPLEAEAFAEDARPGEFMPTSILLFIPGVTGMHS
jgi:hypothetical protein